MAINGLSHITLAVTDVQRSLDFYRDILGCSVRAVWADGAYLEAGSLWLCLSQDERASPTPRRDYTHIAFTVGASDYAALSERLINTCTLWKDNRSEGDSTYFLDPDGHKLELHMGSLETRLAHYRANAAKGVTILDV
ncbi:VOC family protein [Rhizorhabdus argentea]|uniref:VOC family protein n=1 Tax=Rhizorhabdus argentea TaxID=1387174 RepID=UPI003BF5DB80